MAKMVQLDDAGKKACLKSRSTYDSMELLNIEPSLLKILSTDDQIMIGHHARELMEISTSRPNYLDAALDRSLPWMLQNLQSIRRTGRKAGKNYDLELRLIEWHQRLSSNIRKYSALFVAAKNIEDSTDETPAIIYEWAKWVDGTIYTIDPPKIERKQINFIDGQMFYQEESSIMSGLTYSLGDPVALLYRDAKYLAEMAVNDNGIIILARQGTVTEQCLIGQYRDAVEEILYYMRIFRLKVEAVR